MIDLRFVIQHRPGPKWVPNLDFNEQPMVKTHVQYWRTCFYENKLALGGPFLDGSGGMVLCHANLSLEDVERMAENDPAVQNGLLFFEIKQWFIAMKES